MKAIQLTMAERIRRLDKQGLQDLRSMQLRLEKQGKEEQFILDKTDEFLRKHNIGEYSLR